MNVSGWVSFKQIVDDIMLAWGDSSDPGQFMRLLNFAIKGYEGLRLQSLPATKPVILPIQTEMRVVVLPNDFLKFVSIGIVHDGRFFAFTPRSDMPVLSTDDCGVSTRDTVVYPVTQSTFKAYYSLDTENRRVIIDAPISVAEVTLNYTPTGVSMDGVTYIPRMARAVVQAYAENEWVKRDKAFTVTDKAIFDRDYIKALNVFHGYQFDADEIFQEYYTHILTGKQY